MITARRTARTSQIPQVTPNRFDFQNELSRLVSGWLFAILIIPCAHSGTWCSSQVLCLLSSPTTSGRAVSRPVRIRWPFFQISLVRHRGYYYICDVYTYNYNYDVYTYDITMSITIDFLILNVTISSKYIKFPFRFSGLAYEAWKCPCRIWLGIASRLVIWDCWLSCIVYCNVSRGLQKPIRSWTAN